MWFFWDFVQWLSEHEKLLAWQRNLLAPDDQMVNSFSVYKMSVIMLWLQRSRSCNEV